MCTPHHIDSAEEAEQTNERTILKLVIFNLRNPIPVLIDPLEDYALWIIHLISPASP
jgi:hypothetical protein